MKSPMRWYFAVAVLLVCCFGVFVLPFFFPPKPAPGLSASVVAGFNNKIASIAAALISISVCAVAFILYKAGPEVPDADDYRPISRRLFFRTAFVCTGVLAALSFLVLRSGYRYSDDAYYFINQLSMHSDYGRMLYEQIEFPYGPFIFYAPIVMRWLLSPFHVTMGGAYFATLVLEYFVGLILLACVINGLPILRKWRSLFFVLFAFVNIQFNFGINGTYVRFLAAPFLLLMASKAKQPWQLAAALFLGQLACLGISPEVGFGFLVAATGLAFFRIYRDGYGFLFAAAAPLAGVCAFLVVAPKGYIRMLSLFARGYLNVVVEPLPHVLIFLFALVWLVPIVTGAFLRQSRPEGGNLGTLYLFSLAILPVAFGDADPVHIVNNGVTIYALSTVAISYKSLRYQRFWAMCLSIMVIWTLGTYSRFTWWQMEPVARKSLVGDRATFLGTGAAKILGSVAPYYLHRLQVSEQNEKRDTPPLDIALLQSIVGSAPVATPLELPLEVEKALQNSGQYVPSFYCYMTAIVDRDAEIRKVTELNATQWALLPQSGSSPEGSLTPKSVAKALGMYLPYPERAPAYFQGRIFNQNLADNWQMAAEIGRYKLYKRHYTSATTTQTRPTI